MNVTACRGDSNLTPGPNDIIMEYISMFITTSMLKMQLPSFGLQLTNFCEGCTGLVAM